MQVTAVQQRNRDHVRPGLPAELWLEVFEYLWVSNLHVFKNNTHLERWRYTGVDELQKLQFVCRTWRNLIQPFLFRELTLDHYGSNPLLRYLRFSEELKTDSELWDDSSKASWIQAICLRNSGSTSVFQTDKLERFAHALKPFLPAMISLREVSCIGIGVQLTPAQFKLLTRTPQSTIKKLRVSFHQHHLPSILPMFKHFPALQDLDLNVKYLNLGSYYPPDDVPEFPHLRTLRLPSIMLCLEVFDWLTQGSLPVLSEFRFAAMGDMMKSHAPVAKFLLRHGAGLTTLGRLVPFEVRILPSFFANTPNLSCVEVLSEDITKKLYGMPLGVKEVVIVSRRHDGKFPRFITSVAHFVDSWPKQSQLQTVKIVWEFKYEVDDPGFSWRRYKLRKHYSWLKSEAGRLRRRGVEVLDETGMSLWDFLEHHLWEDKVVLPKSKKQDEHF